MADRKFVLGLYRETVLFYRVNSWEAWRIKLGIDGDSSPFDLDLVSSKIGITMGFSPAEDCFLLTEF
jgi:hypothetical protein